MGISGKTEEEDPKLTCPRVIYNEVTLTSVEVTQKTTQRLAEQTAQLDVEKRPHQRGQEKRKCGAELSGAAGLCTGGKDLKVQRGKRNRPSPW